MTRKPADRLPASIRRARALRLRRSLPAPPPMPEVNEANLQRAIVFLAELVTVYGAEFAPHFDAIEAELEKYKQARDPVSRARKVLAENAIDVTTRARPDAGN